MTTRRTLLTAFLGVGLSGAYLIPPFADAHNHGIGTGDEKRDRSMIARYLRAGVFYMQSMGNMPLTRADRDRLGLDALDGVDAALAQGSFSGPGGHPMGLMRNVLLPQGYFPGYTIETLKGVRFYEVGSEQDLQAKWPKLRAAQGDLIKFILFNSDEYDARKDNSAFFGRRGLDPKIAPLIVRMAHRDGLRAAAHVVDVADFRVALDAGVDIIAHLPMEGMLTEQDGRRTAAKLLICASSVSSAMPSCCRCGPATRREQSFRSGRSALCRRVTKPASWRSNAGTR